MIVPAEAGASATPTTETTTPITTTPATVLTSETSGNTAAAEFNGNEYEQSFGLPAGTLKDVKDAESALAIIRSHTDKTLLAGDTYVGGATVPAAETTAAKIGAAAAAAPVTGGNPELDALRAEVNELKGDREKERTAANHREVVEQLRRFESEVDSWASPKYGVTGHRTYDQQRAYRGLMGLGSTHIAGYVATNQASPAPEHVARQVRVFDDKDYKPTQNTTAKPVGTPGSGSKAANASASEPRNIHEALMGSRG